MGPSILLFCVDHYLCHFAHLSVPTSCLFFRPADPSSFSLSYPLQLSDSLSPLHDPCFLSLTFLGSGIQGMLERLGRLSIPKCPTGCTCQDPSGSGPVSTVYKGAREGFQGSQPWVLHRFFSTSPGAEGPHSWHQLPKTTAAVGNLRGEIPNALKRPL